jgi:hypothetical protein
MLFVRFGIIARQQDGATGQSGFECFFEQVALPALLVGPSESAAFLRLAWIWASVAMVESFPECTPEFMDRVLFSFGVARRGDER